MNHSATLHTLHTLTDLFPFPLHGQRGKRCMRQRVSAKVRGLHDQCWTASTPQYASGRVRLCQEKEKKRLGNGHWHTQKVDCQMLFRFYWPWYEWLKRYVFGRSSCSCSRVYLVVFASVCSCSCSLHELQVQVVNQRSLMHMQYDAYSKSRRRWWGLHASLRLTVKGELGYSVMWQKVRSC